ncbi:hypothetical protein DYY67_1164 [Candidatus Nitrosotalea sp. TS]|uniref:hypothetical protein n=1 Tax=Candidatus Nitrosotalea sp. TS TaxID=2341020 RepID=UPI001C499AE2|nr:hypothetical protein [Candidatus Nitrosotalea sp. TS]NHI04306.1 hypothetical protein [Candidatus Nitrosotalea sp. TS]
MSNGSCQRCNKLIKIICNDKKLHCITYKQAIVLGMTMLAMGISGSAFALSSDITLSSLTTVDMKGNQDNVLHAGKPVGFSSVIANHSAGEKRFTYVVRVLDQNNKIQSQSGMSANIVPNQSLTVAESWTPQKAGIYTVQTVLLNGYLMASPLTDAIETSIVVK